MDEKLKEQTEQEVPEKKPLDRKTCVRDYWESCKQDWPGVWVVIIMGMIIALGVAVALFMAHHVIFKILGVIWLLVNWYKLLGPLLSHFLTLCGRCTVALDVMCGTKLRLSDNGTEMYYFCFSHYGSFPVTKWMYENIPAGELFYVVTVPSVLNKPVAIWRAKDYEWIGKPDEIKDYTTRYAAQDQTEERVENTILARRPLTHGRKWKLTGEEIVRDLCENTFWTSERLGGITFGVLAVGALLFLASVKAALIALAVGCVICAALWIERGVWLRRVKAHRFVVSKDVLMDKDPVTRGILKRKTTRYLLSFRKGTCLLPLQDESVYHDAELGDTFFVVRMEGKSKKIRAVYNALDVEWDGDEEE